MGNVWVIVHHYDRGSDEVSLEGAYSSLEKALEAFKEKFPHYQMSEEFLDSDQESYTPDYFWYYSDLDWTDGSDRAMIIHQEVN